MDRLITLRIRTVTGQDEYGEETETWTNVCVWADRRDLRGQERFMAQQQLATLTAKFFVHYREDITPHDQLVDGENTYDIHAVREIGRREGLELLSAHRQGE